MDFIFRFCAIAETAEDSALSKARQLFSFDAVKALSYQFATQAVFLYFLSAICCPVKPLSRHSLRLKHAFFSF